MATRRVRTSRDPSQGTGVDLQLPEIVRKVSSPTLTLATTGDTDADLTATGWTYLDLNQGDPGSVAKAIMISIYVEAVSAAATLAVAQLEFRTAAAGAGTVVVADAALTGLTAAGLAVARTVLPIIITTGKLYVRQKTDSGAAGTIRVHATFVDITPLT